MLSYDFIGQAIDPNTKAVRFQSSAKNQADIHAWFDEHTLKGTFKGLSLVITKRRLFKGKPVHITFEQKLLMMSGVLIIFLVWKLASL